MLGLLCVGAALSWCTAGPGARGAPARARQPLRMSRLSALAARGKDDEPPLPEGEDAPGAEFSTDWDADWRRFQKEGSAGWRPEGREAYTSQDLATARATRIVNDVRASVPTATELVRDTRFWVALLVALALAPSLYTAVQAVSHSGDVLV